MRRLCEEWCAGHGGSVGPGAWRDKVQHLHPSSVGDPLPDPSAVPGYPVTSMSFPRRTTVTLSSSSASDIHSTPLPPTALGASVPPMIFGAMKNVILFTSPASRN